jgi:HSF-type DNA-binding
MEDLTTEPSMKDMEACRSLSNTPDSSKQKSDKQVNHDSPLMKLVDAALGPNASVSEDTVSAQCNEDLKVKGRDNSVADAVDTAVTLKQPPPSQDIEVLRGSIQDLVSHQDKKVTFAEFLMECLNDTANHDVLRWMPCGTQFTITNHRKFAMERMPQLFKIRNMSSFVRKLTRWGFSRVHEKATGNSDIFKHTNFQRDKPELCKKIRCVNRSATEEGKKSAIAMDMRLSQSMLMGNFSESSNRHNGFNFDHDMSLLMNSPRRSMTHSVSLFHGRSPPDPSRFHHSRQTPGASSSYLPPRISPESEREMMERSAFHARLTPPQVYAPPRISRTMSAAAEYELEQVLLERQRARMFRNEQQRNLHAVHQQQQQRSHHVDIPIPNLDAGSERSMDAFADCRYDNEQSLLSSPGNPSTVTAAFDNLRYEGEYDFDMSPREAMLRAVLHKRQQQRATHQQRTGTNVGNGILKKPSPYIEPASRTRQPNQGMNPSHFR